MTRPRITVVTTCLNQGRFIERTICSVLDQGYERVQYLVVDRGSTDETGDLINLYARELTWLSAPGASRAGAINAALAQATGDIVVVVDDLLLPFALEEAARAMSGPDAADWVVGQCVRVNEDDLELGESPAMAPPTLAAFLMHDSGLLPLASTFIRRRLLGEYGRFNDELLFAFDYEYWCRLLADGLKPVVLATAVAAIRESGAIPSAATTLQQGLEYIATAGRYAHHLPWREQVALWRNRDRRRRIYALAEAEIQPAQARRLLWHRLLRRPWWIVDDSLRHALVHGVRHPATEGVNRAARATGAARPAA